jgi:hypothetical protein
VNVFDAQWSAFLDDIEGNGPMDNSGEYGQSVCAIIDAIYRSDATGTEQGRHRSSVAWRALVTHGQDVGKPACGSRYYVSASFKRASLRFTHGCRSKRLAMCAF